MNDLKELLEHIKDLSLNEKKTVLERALKLQEESGELAQEILILNKASGLQYKDSGQDGALGECVDICLVALSIFFKLGGSIEDFQALTKMKSEKWARFQK